MLALALLVCIIMTYEIYYASAIWNMEVSAFWGAVVEIQS